MAFDLPPEISKDAPGVFGSLVSMLWLKDTWPRKTATFLAGAVLSRYGTGTVSNWAGLDGGFTGFLMGLFGMALVSMAFEWLQRSNPGSLFTEWLRKVLGLPPKEDTPPEGD